MKKKTYNKGITLRDVVNHISTLSGKIDRVDRRLSGKIDGLTKRIGRLEVGFLTLNRMVNTMDIKLSNIDERLDTIEISIVEQKHEPRIRRIERHLGFSAV
jgi:hypothetical protein